MTSERAGLVSLSQWYNLFSDKFLGDHKESCTNIVRIAAPD
jgi:hypothetical protein